MGYLKRHSLELQFWGYEIGNIVAAIAGAGGLSRFLDALRSAWASGAGPLAALTDLMLRFPEAAATLGVVALVVFAYPVARLAIAIGGRRGGDAVHAAAVPLALGLLGYAIIATASAFTLAACAFVAGSCLLRSAGSYPVLLKLGGLALSLGGVALAAAGAMLPMGSVAEAGFAISTFLAGCYVVGAGLLTYRGGCFVIAELGPQPRAETPFAALLHPTRGPVARVLVRGLDRIVARVTHQLVLPAIFWASAETKAKRPFYLSMLARLPWRVVAIGFALAAGGEIGLAFVLANALWALGDIAIGALDAPERPVTAEPGVRIR